MIILDEFVDFFEVIGIKMIAFYAKMSLNSFIKEYLLRFLWVGDPCPNSHLFELGCHVLAKFGEITARSSISVLLFALSICMCSSLFR